MAGASLPPAASIATSAQEAKAAPPVDHSKTAARSPYRILHEKIDTFNLRLARRVGDGWVPQGGVATVEHKGEVYCTVLLYKAPATSASTAASTPATTTAAATATKS